jgi:uncharacterized RDD family membrane protein YckC
VENIAWYYEVDGACIGPVTQEALCHLLRTGSIGPATRVRCEALPDWMLAAQVPGFQAVSSPPPMPGALQQQQQPPPHLPGAYLVQPDPAIPQVLQAVPISQPQAVQQEPTLPNFPPTPASLPGAPGGPDTVQPNYLVWDNPAAAAQAAADTAAQGEAVMLAVRPPSANFESSNSSSSSSSASYARAGEENVPQIRPWVRFWARGIDAMVAGFAFAICCLGWAALAGPMGKWTFLLCAGFFVLWIFVEAFMLSEMGTTIGKAVLGVTVRNEEGHDLSFGQALARAFRVWLSCGIPLINLIGMIVAYFRLTGDGATSWDRQGRFTVSHSRVGVVRGIMAFVSIIGLWGMTVFASSIAASATDPGAPIIAASAATAPPVSIATIPSITIPPPAPPAPVAPVQLNPDRRSASGGKAPTAAVTRRNPITVKPSHPGMRGPAANTNSAAAAARARRAERTQTASAAPTFPGSDQDPSGGGSSADDGKIMIIRKTR